MFPIDFVLEEDDYLDDTTYATMDEDDEDAYFGSVARAQSYSYGCSPYLKPNSPKSMREACGPVRGLGRNRQTVLASQNRADFVALDLELGDSRNMQRVNESKRKRKVEPWCFPITIIGILVVLIIFLPLISPERVETKQPSDQQCDDQCKLVLVESIPEHLTYPAGSPSFPSTYSSWINLIQSAQQSIDIGSFYWDLREAVGGALKRRKTPYTDGERIFKELVKAGLHRKIKVRIAQSESDPVRFPNNDTALLEEMGAAEVRSLNFTYLLGSGVLHTKMWIIDNQHFWIGSANMDWRSLTEVKELGLTGFNCSCLANDLAKIFSVYWYLGAPGNTSVPSRWPSSFSTLFNRTNPFSLNYNNSAQPYNVYMASSPPSFCPDGRTSDIEALVSVITAARKFVYIAVMDYTPTLEDQFGKRYWPLIDDALRTAAYNRPVNVRMLVSKWNHTNPRMVYHLRSMLAINGATKGKIEIKWFEVPSFTPAEKDIPFARVNHNKYMVTDTTAYIGTSNWEGSYFTTTAGVSIILNDTLSSLSDVSISSGADGTVAKQDNFTTVRDQLASVFLRDWDSEYASDVV